MFFLLPFSFAHFRNCLQLELFSCELRMHVSASFPIIFNAIQMRLTSAHRAHTPHSFSYSFMAKWFFASFFSLLEKCNLFIGLPAAYFDQHYINAGTRALIHIFRQISPATRGTPFMCDEKTSRQVLRKMWSEWNPDTVGTYYVIRMRKKRVNAGKKCVNCCNYVKLN